MSDEVKHRLQEANWEQILPQLTRYTQKLVRFYRWRYGSGDLPHGKQIEDLVFESIGLVFKGCQEDLSAREKRNVRNWNPESSPDLELFLRGVIKSRIYHLVNSKEHTQVQRFQNSQINEEENIAVREDLFSETQFVPTPEHIVLFKESQIEANAFIDRLTTYAQEKEDIEMVELLECIRADITKPSEISAYTDISVTRVNNAKKRLRRLVQRELGLED